MPTQKSFSPADPAIVPVEGPVLSEGNAAAGREGKRERRTAVQINPYGQNNEQTSRTFGRRAAAASVSIFVRIGRNAAAGSAPRIKQAHQFWRGLQYLWWNERDQNWHLPFEQKLSDNSTLEDLPRYEFVTNIYQAFWTFAGRGAIAGRAAHVRFFPSSAQAEEDVAAAKAATEVAQLVERNNRIGNLIVEEAFNLWTDGKVGAYVRFVVDGQRFGFHPETEIAAREMKIGSDVYVCPECGAENQAQGSEFARKGSVSGEKGGGLGEGEDQEFGADSVQPNADEGSDTQHRQALRHGMQGAAYRGGFCSGGISDSASQAENSPARAKWAGSSDNRWWLGTEDAALG